ncbi:iron-sulfur cluster repair di-iron protein, ric [Youngiibacter fragilis]|nr:iron-sulfur cluster repair di-iron protein, ric [Youngiibacter fragilis]
MKPIKGKKGKDMSKQFTFGGEMKGNLKKLDLYVPVVERVHGGHHPEFHEVRRLYDEVARKIREGRPELNEEFARLREVTGNYTVPGDVCESYEVVYSMLAEIDKAYSE